MGGLDPGLHQQQSLPWGWWANISSSIKKVSPCLSCVWEREPEVRLTGRDLESLIHTCRLLAANLSSTPLTSAITLQRLNLGLFFAEETLNGCCPQTSSRGCFAGVKVQKIRPFSLKEQRETRRPTRKGTSQWLIRTNRQHSEWIIQTSENTKFCLCHCANRKSGDRGKNKF